MADTTVASSLLCRSWISSWNILPELPMKCYNFVHFFPSSSFFFCTSKHKVEPRSYSFSDSHRVLHFGPPVTSGESKLMGFCSASSWKFSPNLKKMQQMCLDLSRPNEVTQTSVFKTLPCIWQRIIPVVLDIEGDVYSAIVAPTY